MSLMYLYIAILHIFEAVVLTTFTASKYITEFKTTSPQVNHNFFIHYLDIFSYSCIMRKHQLTLHSWSTKDTTIKNSFSNTFILVKIKQIDFRVRWIKAIWYATIYTLTLFYDKKSIQNPNKYRHLNCRLFFL